MPKTTQTVIICDSCEEEELIFEEGEKVVLPDSWQEGDDNDYFCPDCLAEEEKDEDDKSD